MLVVLPAIAYATILATGAVLGRDALDGLPFWFQMQFMKLLLSPLQSWQGPVLGVLLAVWATRRGVAGWLVAALAGTVILLLTRWLLGPPSLIAVPWWQRLWLDLQLNPPGALFGLAAPRLLRP